MGSVPLIHASQPGITLMNGYHRALRQCVEFGIGDNGGDLNDHILIRDKAGHFHVHPNEIAGILHAMSALGCREKRQCNKLPRQTKSITQ